MRMRSTNEATNGLKVSVTVKDKDQLSNVAILAARPRMLPGKISDIINLHREINDQLMLYDGLECSPRNGPQTNAEHGNV